MILSRTATYALRAVLCLAEMETDDPVRVDDIADRLDVPRNYLSKILHALARAGTLTSMRGPGGGFRLSRPAEELRLSAVVEPFDDLLGQSGCVLGRDVCSDVDSCSAHDRWQEVVTAVRAFLLETTVADLRRRPRAAGATGTR